MAAELHYLLFDQLKDILSQVFFTWIHIYILWNHKYNNKKYCQLFAVLELKKIYIFSIMLHYD